jgi:hypothetical protein
MTPFIVDSYVDSEGSLFPFVLSSAIFQSS